MYTGTRQWWCDWRRRLNPGIGKRQVTPARQIRRWAPMRKWNRWGIRYFRWVLPWAWYRCHAFPPFKPGTALFIPSSLPGAAAILRVDEGYLSQSTLYTAGTGKVPGRSRYVSRATTVANLTLWRYTEVRLRY